METRRGRNINPDRKYYEYKRIENETVTAPEPEMDMIKRINIPGKDEDGSVRRAPKPEKKENVNSFRKKIPVAGGYSERSSKQINDYYDDYGDYDNGELEYENDDLEPHYEGEEIWKEEEPKEKENYVLAEIIGLVIIAVLVIGVFLYSKASNKSDSDSHKTQQPSSTVATSTPGASAGTGTELSDTEKLDYIKANASLYNEKLTAALEKNPEIVDFVYNYPNESHEGKETNMDSEANAGNIPTLSQWDARWGYIDYAGSVVGLAGSGPTCMSAVALYLTKNAAYTPVKVSEYARNHEFTEENTTKKSFFTEAASQFEISAIEVSPSENVIKALVDSGIPVICAMGPGDFGSNEQYIVISGFSGGFKVMDPFSKANSEKIWDFSSIGGQITKSWAYFGPALAEKTFKVNGTNVNVRKDANQSAEIVKKANTGEEIKIKSLKVNDSMVWGELEDGNYICMNYVTG